VPKPDPLRQLSDSSLRAEVARRRLLYLSLSIVITLIALIVIGRLGQAGFGPIGAISVLVVALANLAAVLFLFRWMSQPSRERARRRRLSVLKMLGVEKSETEVDEEIEEPEKV
jgi:heme/copper-type cytochrome/quinol oxidase subunit 4